MSGKRDIKDWSEKAIALIGAVLTALLWLVSQEKYPQIMDNLLHWKRNQQEQTMQTQQVTEFYKSKVLKNTASDQKKKKKTLLFYT